MRRILMAAAAAVLFVAGAAQAQNRDVTYVQVGRLLADPATGRVETNKTLVISGGKVLEVRDGFVGGQDGPVIDLKDSFVLPGLIDTHVHLLNENGPNARINEVTRSKSRTAIDGAQYALRTLRAGFTTVADVGDDNEPIFALRDGIAAGNRGRNYA